MKHIAMIAAAVATAICSLLCSGCLEKIFGEKGYHYEILKSGHPERLVFIVMGSTDSDIVGIDTTTFTIEAWVRMKNMSIGGVAKLPQGGIAFTHHRRISDNAWGETLYVTDDCYSIIGTYPVCPSPMGPKVIGNTLMVGSSALNENGKYKFQVLDAATFQLRKEFQLEDSEDAWEISAYENHAYFDVDVGPPFTGNSYIVQLDLSTLSTTEFSGATNFFKEAAFSCCRKDSLLYVVNLLSKNLCLINLNSKIVGNVVEVSHYPQVAAVNAVHLIAPMVIGDHLYAFLGSYDEDGNYICHWLKLNAKTLTLEDIRKNTLPNGYSNGGYQLFAGRFWVVGVKDSPTENVVFIDFEKGEVVNIVTFII
jgi:hypothetical protein